MNVRADQNFEMNITRAFVETLMNTLEVNCYPLRVRPLILFMKVWNDKSFDSLVYTRQVYYPYFIRNETGLPMSYRLSTNPDEVFQLAPGDEQPLPIASKPAKIRRYITDTAFLL